MKHIAITGGIGSGKTYVCKLLSLRGISVYDCDAAAKRLMRSSKELQKALCELVGNDVYRDGILQKKRLASFLLASDDHRQAVNDIVHPAVAEDYLLSGQEWLESAILFESGFYQRVAFDYIICVTAPEDIRLQRIMHRDSISKEKAHQWIVNQMPQEDILQRSDYEIQNNGIRPLAPQIDALLNIIQSNHTNHSTF